MRKCTFATLRSTSGPSASTSFLAASFTCAETPRPRLHAHRFSTPVQPIDECFPRQDGSRRHREIGFRFCPLLQANLLPVLQQGSFDYPCVSKFVRQSPGTLRLLREQIFNDPRMSPAQQAVQVAKFFVKIVIALRPDGDRIRSTDPGVVRMIFARARIRASDPIRLLS